MKRYLAVFFVLALCVALLALPASGATTGAATSPTKDELRAMWETVTTASTVFQEEPSIMAPYAAGSLTEDFLESGITYLNFIRFVAGLPAVTLDTELNDLAQHGAVCLAAIDQLTHFPSRPADMPKDFFDKGYEATTSSNISARMGYEAEECLQSAVQGCMSDSGDNNLATVGHRRWLLNPTLGKVGFGYAEAHSGWMYVDTYVFDRSGQTVDYDFISWPVAGNQPNEIFFEEDPWSVSLNPNKYKAPNLNNISITITQQSDGTTWTFDASTGKPTSNYYPYLTVNNDWYGIPNCMIFHPGYLNVEEYMGLYTVEITGLYTTAGKATTLTYQVDFFDMKQKSCDHIYGCEEHPATCTEAGLTVYTCYRCGDQYTETVPALGHNWQAANCQQPALCLRCYTTEGGLGAHNYEQGSCTLCGAKEPGAVSKWDIGYANMTLGNSLAMNFAFAKEHEEDWSGCYVQIVKVYADGRPDKVLRIDQADWSTVNIGGKAHWLAAFPGVAAKEMSDKVYVTVYNAQGEAISNTWEDSVRSYAMRLLNNPSTGLETQIMAIDLLNYGAAAQQNFKYNTGDLANSQLSAAQKALATKTATAKDSRKTQGNYLGTNLGLESQILMRMAFTGTNESMSAKIKFTNHAGRKITVDVPGSEFGKSGVIVIDEIVIADGRQPVTVTVYNADGSVYASATDSLESYIARMSNAGALYEMILKFSDSAYNFFH